MVILKYKKSGKVLKLWHVNANSVDVMRLNILSWGLLDPIGTYRVNLNTYFNHVLELWLSTCNVLYMVATCADILAVNCSSSW